MDVDDSIVDMENSKNNEMDYGEVINADKIIPNLTNSNKLRANYTIKEKYKILCKYKTSQKSKHMICIEGGLILQVC
jgi:hypothetical protein